MTIKNLETAWLEFSMIDFGNYMVFRADRIDEEDGQAVIKIEVNGKEISIKTLQEFKFNPAEWGDVLDFVNLLRKNMGNE